MFRSPHSTRRRGVAVLMLLSAAVCLRTFSAPASAAEPVNQSGSLKFVPQDVAFYGSFLRNKEQYDTLVNSRAFARIKDMAMPWVGMLTQLPLFLGDTGPWEQFPEWSSVPENQQLMDLLGDMVSHEIFVYGEKGYADMINIFGRANTARQMAPLLTLIAGGSPEDMQIDQLRAILEFIKNNPRPLKIPTTLIGFKITQADRARDQIDRLEAMVNEVIVENPELAQRFERTKIAGNDYLTLKLDGSMIPWDDIPLDQLEEEEGEFDAVVDKISQMTLTLTLGVRDDFLLLLIGESNDHLKSVPRKLLYNHRQLAPLRKYADKRITAVGYVSQEFMRQVDQSRQQFNQLVEMLEMVLPETDLEDELQNEIVADTHKVRDFLLANIPQPGAQLSFDFLTENGYEGYHYNWGENKFLDGSQRISVLNHVGGNPLGFFAIRTRYIPENVTAFSNFFKRGFYYFEKYGLEELDLDLEERTRYAQIRDKAMPILKRIERATRTMLVPSLKDGQSALVFDAKIQSNRWFEDMPPSNKPVPMLELALVYGVSDAPLFKQAVKEYLAAVQDVLDGLHEAMPDDVPEMKIPNPTSRSASSGTIYTFPNVEDVYLDEQLRVNGGLSDKLAVISLSPPQTERLLNKTPLKVLSRPLSTSDRPLASAAYFNWAGFLDAIYPWIEYGVVMNFQGPAAGNGGPDPADNPFVQAILAQAKSGLEVLQCFRSYSSVTFLEDDAIVTHRETRWQDVPE